MVFRLQWQGIDGCRDTFKLFKSKLVGGSSKLTLGNEIIVKSFIVLKLLNCLQIMWQDIRVLQTILPYLGYGIVQIQNNIQMKNIHFSKIEGSMKSLKNIKPKIGIQNNHMQSSRFNGMQLRKQEFFKDVIKSIQAQFHQEDLDFLMQSTQINFNKDKKQKYNNRASHHQRHSHLSITAEEEPLPKEIVTEIKKQNLNPFQTCYKQFLMKSKPTIQREVKQYSCTPIRASLDIKKRLPKRLFHVDQKMRKNYQRIKQRIIFNSPEDTFRATNSIKTSIFPERFSKTQRACRYKTECPDSQNQVEEFCVPRMLLGDLVQRKSFQEERHNLLDSNQKRLLCFKRNDNNSMWGIRRRFKVHQ